MTATKKAPKAKIAKIGDNSKVANEAERQAFDADITSRVDSLNREHTKAKEDKGQRAERAMTLFQDVMRYADKYNDLNAIARFCQNLAEFGKIAARCFNEMSENHQLVSSKGIIYVAKVQNSRGVKYDSDQFESLMSFIGRIDKLPAEIGMSTPVMNEQQRIDAAKAKAATLFKSINKDKLPLDVLIRELQALNRKEQAEQSIERQQKAA